MVYCENCGSKYEETDAFCPQCGTENENFVPEKDTSDTQKGKYIPQSYDQAQSIGLPGLRQPKAGDSQRRYNKEYDGPLSAPIRSWGLWLVIAIGVAIAGSAILGFGSTSAEYFDIFAFPFGVVYAIYIYYNFEDFQKHLTNAHSSSEYTPKTPITSSVGFLIVIIAIPLTISVNYYDPVSSVIFYYFIVNSPILILMFVKNKMLYEHLESHGEIERGTSPAAAVMITFFTFTIGALYVDWRWQHNVNKHLKRTEGYWA